MEKEVVASGLDWTIVRPTLLNDKQAARLVRYERISRDFSAGPYSISHADLAMALLDLTENTSEAGVALAVSGAGKR